ncbi:MAG: hypothetical protein ACE5FL_16010 [Myxococcota bacterium]
MTRLGEAVAAAERWLTDIYRLDLDICAARCVLSPERVRALLRDGAPSTGVVAVEADGELQLGLYVDPGDRDDPDAVVEETSHLLCLAWHAVHDRPLSRLVLEIQGEVDRYAVARLQGRDAFRHFERFAWAPGLDADARDAYAAAHRVGLRYCRGLARRFPSRGDTPGLLDELRRFYRTPPEQKLGAA